MTVKKKENRAKEREEGMRAERTQCVCVFVNVSMRLSVCVRERKGEGGMVKQSRCASDQSVHCGLSSLSLAHHCKA